MRGTVEYAPGVTEMLRAIGDHSVIRTLIDIANTELCFVRPGANEDYQGRLLDDPSVMWRRGIWLHELPTFRQLEGEADEYRRQACDYLLLYRQKTTDEKINFNHTHDSLIVVGVHHNTDPGLVDRIRYGRWTR